MPSNIKLTYFNLRGRAEIPRLILAQAGVDYEDERIERDSWMALKPNTPCGQLPVLEYNGVKIAQSMTIARFLAKEFNLAGQNRIEEAKANMIVDCVTDIFNGVVQIFKEKDESRKAELQKTFSSETLPNALKMFDKLFKANEGKYFVGKDLTWADIVFSTFCSDFMARHGKDMLKDFDALNAHVDHVMNLPNIKKWIQKRPKTEM